MIGFATWQAIVLGVGLVLASLLAIIWWRQQSFRWPIALLLSLIAAPLLSWWSGQAFQVPDYRAGCSAVCLGYRGAPLAIFQSDSLGGAFLPVMFAVNSLVYLLIVLIWSMVMRAMLHRPEGVPYAPAWSRVLLGLLLSVGPVALAPLYLPPPEANVHGEPQRIAINAQREVYLYDQLAAAPILRVGLEDVRPRTDKHPGMRVCLRTYTVFYVPTGHMYLDMTPEGVHSNAGGVLPLRASCWQ